MATTNYRLGQLTSTPIQRRDSLNSSNTEDVYSFSINDTRSINLALRYTTSDGVYDVLRLYRDNNSNGVLDSSDTYLYSDEEAIDPYFSAGFTDYNYVAPAGSYLVPVYHAFGEVGNSNYTLNLSATPPRPYPADNPTLAPNILPKEIELGDIRLGTILLNDPAHSKTITRTGWVGNSDSADTYHFKASSRGDGVGIKVALTGLSNDADVRLIEDRDRDGIVDRGEVIKSSALGGIANESFEISRSNLSLSESDYFVQVYQYSGNTNYNLNMTFTSTLM